MLFTTPTVQYCRLYGTARPKPGRTILMDWLTFATLILATMLLTTLAVIAYQFDRDQIHKS